MAPKPEIAEQLDATFKHMGFHQKSMRPAAKDLVLKPYALPKHQKLVDPHKRRLSLSHKVPSVVERVRVFSPDGRAAALRASSSKKPSSPAMVSTRISSSSKVPSPFELFTHPSIHCLSIYPSTHPSIHPSFML